jgi:hypothetical protein
MLTIFAALSLMLDLLDEPVFDAVEGSGRDRASSDTVTVLLFWSMVTGFSAELIINYLGHEIRFIVALPPRNA